MEYFKVQAAVLEKIEKGAGEIVSLGTALYQHPETGFREFTSAAMVAERLRGLGLPSVELKDIPGVIATIDTGKAGPALAIVGELDALLCPAHPDSDKNSGAMHACGHNAQIAALFGAVIGLIRSGALQYLAGKIVVMAVPAEEYIEIEYRMGLLRNGTIHYLGGKPEFLSRGLFDDVDLCQMIHLMPGKKKVLYGPTTNGFLSKQVQYIGAAAHAGSAPQDGINALYAANLGIMAVNAIRETFRDEDHIRVHPIITRGGDAVNVIPDRVTLETLVRGKTIQGIVAANEKIDKALAGGALSMGAAVKIEDMPGYLPYIQDEGLALLSRRIAQKLVGDDHIADIGHQAFSTDLGDLSALMPVMQTYIGGVGGKLHGEDFRILDDDTAYVLGAKILALSTLELLWNDAEKARDIIAHYKPTFASRDDYFRFVNSLSSIKTANSFSFQSTTPEQAPGYVGCVRNFYFMQKYPST